MTQEIKTEKFEGLLVKVPEADAYGFRISYGSYVVLSWKHKYKSSDAYRITDNTSEKWKIIGNPFELTEDEVLKIIPRMKDSGYPFEIEDWDESWINTLDMLKVYSDNPCEYPIIHDFSSEERYKEQYSKWKDAEERTGNWILLEKLNN